ncbi:MAG TPA: RlmE family RNA methyltransferase [Thermoplasmata archaeon]|nr:RlmE family RNA methyltransferase [Thermoplasmata archaeon]
MSRRFLDDRRRDPFYRAAQSEGLRSRAAFKLDYLDRRFRLLPRDGRVLDLGAAPGGWSVVAADRVGPRGRVVAVDPRPIEPIEGVRVVRGRVGDADLIARLGPEPFDLVISDMSPRISGAYATDHARSAELVREALRLAEGVLDRGGAFAAKVFDGDLVAELESEMERSFARVHRTKPPASREASSELYLVGVGFGRGRARHRGPAPPRASDI